MAFQVTNRPISIVITKPISESNVVATVRITDIPAIAAAMSRGSSMKLPNLFFF